MAKGKIICAIDFGTTYSGVAYAYYQSGMEPSEVDVEIIEDHWPGQGNQSSQKVPSEFKFDSSAPGGFKWGFQVENDPEKISFSKLYLDPTQIQSAQSLAKFTAKIGRLPPDRTLTEGITLFLKAICEVAADRMIADWTKEFVDKTPIEYILTVPAVWSDKSKSDTLKCAVDAGFCSAGEVSLITEPEAAAVYTFTTLPEYSIKEGDIFLTCDAGGGTVDLITYRVLGTKPVLKVEEATLGTGGLCGSVYLNRRFEDFVTKKIGKYLDALPRVAYVEGMTEIHRAFNEEVKTDFGHGLEDEKEYTIEVPAGVPDSEEAGVRDGCLVIRQKDLEEVFDPVIDRIVMLIAEQIEAVAELPGEKKVSAILLVGGFGSSEYLRRKIEGNPIWQGTDVIQPVNAWSAVVRGALLRGLQGDIVSTRKIRNFYGIEYRQTWEPEIHEVGNFANEAAKHKLWSDIEQRYFCAQRMNWYVKRGDEFSSSMVVNFPFYRAITDTAQLLFTEELVTYTSSGDAPDFMDSQCSVLAGIEVDLTSFPLETWQTVQGPAGSYYKVEYALEMSFEAAISFKVVCKGTVVGEIVADYDKK